MEQTTLTPVWTLGDRLRKARDFADITSTDMAGRLGVSRNTITNYENDHTRPSLLALRAYSAETGVPLTWITGENEADIISRCFREDGTYQLEFGLAA